MFNMRMDLELMKQSFGSDEKFIAILIDRFIRGVPEDMDKLKIFSKEKKWDNVRAASHKLLNSTKIFNMEEPTSLLEKIEKFSERKINLVRIPELISQFETSCNNSLNEMKKLRRKIK